MVLDLIHKEKSEIPYVIHKFPDGELHLELLTGMEEIAKDTVKILCRIKSADDLFIYQQAVSIFAEQELHLNIHIFYLMSQRMDRQMSPTRAFSLELVLWAILSNLDGNDSITFYCPHPPNLRGLIKNCYSDGLSIPQVHIAEYNQWPITDGDVVCFPDKGALERFGSKFSSNILYGEKVRDESGKIVSLIIKEKSCSSISKYPIIYVIDDLCDGGGTFEVLYEKLQEEYPNHPKFLIVTHMIQLSAIDKLSKLYDHITFTNSFRDWKQEDMPENCDIIDIIGGCRD